MNESIRAGKSAVKDEIVVSIKKAQSTSVIEYRGLTVKEFESLRRDLRKAGADMKVFKNTFVAKASEELGFGDVDKVLEGPNALVFSNKDSVSGPKTLLKFAKNNQKLVIKGGIVDGKVVSADDLKTIATLPTKEGLLSMLLSCLNAPVSKFARAVQAVADAQSAQN